MILLLACLLYPSAGQAAGRIVFLGDSLTAGYSLDRDQAFPALIQQRLRNEGLDYTVVNSGVSGDTTAGGLRRLDWLMRQPIDLLVIALGANDGLRGFDTEFTEHNLDAIIEKVRTRFPDIPIVLAGMKLPANMGDEHVRAFEAIFPRVASRHGVVLLPFLLEGVAGDPDLNLADGIHPDPEGHRIIADHVWTVLSPLLAARRTPSEHRAAGP